MIDIETYLTIFKVGDEIIINEMGSKSPIHGVTFLQDPKTKWLKNTKSYYLSKVEFTIQQFNPETYRRVISLDKVIELNKDKVRDYKLCKLLPE